MQQHGTKSAPEPIRLYMQAQLRAWLAEDPKRRSMDFAKLSGLSNAQISQIKNGARSVGLKAERGFARALGITIDELEKRAYEAWNDPSQPVHKFRLIQGGQTPTENENLPGWSEAEKEARAYSNMPDWTFLIARKRTGLVPRGGVTLDYVMAEAWLALHYAKPEDALRITSEEYGRKGAALAKRAKFKKRRKPKGLPPPTTPT